MKPEEEIVTVRITLKEAQKVAANRWVKSRINKALWVFVACMIAAFVLVLIDAPLGSPQGTHHIGKYIVGGLGMGLMLLGFAPGYWLIIRADRIGKDEAKKLIV